MPPHRILLRIALRCIRGAVIVQTASIITTDRNVAICNVFFAFELGADVHRFAQKRRTHYLRGPSTDYGHRLAPARTLDSC
jgi:hypothetical protein